MESELFALQAVAQEMVAVGKFVGRVMRTIGRVLRTACRECCIQTARAP